MDSGKADALKRFDASLANMRVWARGGNSNPHKYMLLLSIAAELRRDPLHPNRFTFQELEPLFLAQFEESAPQWPESRRNLEYPFYHLQRDGYWHLALNEGQEDAYRRYEETRLTRNRLIETVAFAYLNDEVFELMHDSDVQHLVERKLMEVLDNTDPDSRSLGSLFSHEQVAIRSIQEQMAPLALGTMLNNVHLYHRELNEYYEYDLIVVAHTGIYVAELKHWSGHIHIAPYNWPIDGCRYREDPHRLNGFKCRLLKGLYEHQFPTYPSIWVESIVVLTNPEATVEGADSPSVAATGTRHNLTFASIEDFLTYLRKKESVLDARLLDDRQITAILSSLRALASPARRHLYQVPGYETVQYLSQRPECIVLVARPTDGRSRGLNRFRIFRVPAGASAEERERVTRQAYNTLEAVSRIGDHPNVHKVWALRSDEGDIIEGSDWSEAGTLKDLIAGQDEPLPVEEALAICRGLALALGEAHRAGITHRNAKPEHVLMMNGIPKLSDFDLSFRLDRDPQDITVLPDSTHLKDDGYTAPELLEGRGFDESSDLFALGVIAYELLTGTKPFAKALGFAAQGGKLDDQQIQRLRARVIPEKAIHVIHRVVVGDRLQRLQEAQEMAQAFLPDEEDGEAEQIAQPMNARLEPGTIYDVYEALELVGEGAEAQIYRARTIREEEVALKLFNREVPKERIVRELTAASSIHSSHVVRSDGHIGHWRNDRYFVVLEYVVGETLRKRIERGERPDAASFRKVALGLMDGLAAFHGHRDDQDEWAPLVHGDVKPDNILITRDGEVKLTDFSVVGPPRVDEFQGTVGYVPPDRTHDEEMAFAPDGDLFALGVSLWEWVFAQKPYQTPAVGVGDELVRLKGTEPALPVGWPGWLERAVATRETDRFASVEEMREAFLQAEAEGREEVVAAMATAVAAPSLLPESLPAIAPTTVSSATNPFVAYLNTLSNASAGNENATAEAQATNQFFERIRVPNPLTEFVIETLVVQKRNLILTGNAGDGKTTIAAEVYLRLTDHPMPVAPRVEIPEANIVIVKDMSELATPDRVQALEEAAGDTGRVHLVVSNTGTLLESAKRIRIYGVEPYHVQSDLLTAMEADEARSVLGDHFLLLNVGRTDSIATACQVLRRMLAARDWNHCATCTSGEHCPVYGNVRMISESPEVVIGRIELLCRRLYEYGIRLTMRQMTGHLAYALTGGRECEDIRGLGWLALQAQRSGLAFFNRFFGDDGEEMPPETAQLAPVRNVREAEFGVALDPAFEQATWPRDQAQIPLTGAALELFRQLKGEGEVVRPAARRQVRRLVYFFGAEDGENRSRYVSTFLRSPMLTEYLAITKGSAGIPPLWEGEWRCRVMQVLQEYFLGVRLPEGSWEPNDRLYVTLNRRSSGSATQVVLASFATDEFKIIVRPGHRAVKDSNGRLALQLLSTGTEMALDLPFLDYVARRYEGEVAAQLSAFYADRLERFHADLIHNRSATMDEESLHLLRVGTDRRFKPVRILFVDDHLEVL